MAWRSPPFSCTGNNREDHIGIRHRSLTERFSEAKQQLQQGGLHPREQQGWDSTPLEIPLPGPLPRGCSDSQGGAQSLRDGAKSKKYSKHVRFDEADFLAATTNAVSPPLLPSSWDSVLILGAFVVVIVSSCLFQYLSARRQKGLSPDVTAVTEAPVGDSNPAESDDDAVEVEVLPSSPSPLRATSSVTASSVSFQSLPRGPIRILPTPQETEETPDEELEARFGTEIASWELLRRLRQRKMELLARSELEDSEDGAQPSDQAEPSVAVDAVKSGDVVEEVEEGDADSQSQAESGPESEVCVLRSATPINEDDPEDLVSVASGL